MIIKEAKLKLARYCAYQERSQKEARKKLYELGVYGDDTEEVIVELIADNFINEERFAKAYIGGKFRAKRWGRNKILFAIKQHDISDYCIRSGMKEIDEDDYRNTLEHLIESKNETLQEENLFIKRNKISKTLIAKGFESELVWQYLKENIQ
ncbi:MAG: regulatory protein [Cyclobacteriaceae bacterium]|jgi:regulatory protein